MLGNGVPPRVAGNRLHTFQPVLKCYMVCYLSMYFALSNMYWLTCYSFPSASGPSLKRPPATSVANIFATSAIKTGSFPVVKVSPSNVTLAMGWVALLKGSTESHYRW